LRIEDATELLESLIGPRTTEENQQLRLLAEQCACLPLALRIAAEVVVSHPDKTVQELCLDLRDQRQRIKILSDSDDPEAAISSVLSWSYDKLQPIHASAFRRLSLHPGADYDIFAVAALLEGSAENALGVMEVLRRKNLIETLAGERFRIHDILRGYASALSHQEDSAPERLECFKRLSDYYVGTATIAMNLLFPVDREKRVGLDRVTVTGPQLTDRSGARRWLTSERANIAQIAGLPRSSQGAAELLQTVWRFYTTSGYYDDAHRIADASMKSARDSGDSAAEAVALQLSGLISILEGRPDRAPESLLQAIDIQRANVIPAVLATSLFYLGQAYAHMGEYTRALVHHQDALALYKVANDRLGIANAEGNIGYVLWRLGRYTESYASHGKALRQHWALRHEPGVASTLDSLGRLNRSMGRIRKAIQQHRTAVRRQRQLEHHLGEAKAFENLGLCYSVLKDFPVARRQFDEALAICDVRGFERLERRILNSRAEAALASKDVRNAERDYATVLASAVPAGDREEEARACKGVCEIREVEGRPAEAVGFARRSLDIYRALGVPEAIAAADRFDALLRHCGT
jgi:tetratricopeptide (TPR) repeat protein